MRSSLREAIWGGGGLRAALGDAAVVVLLVAASLASLAVPLRPAGAGGRASVSVKGRTEAVVDLERDGLTSVRGPLGETVVEVREGRVRILASPCPRQLCLLQGWQGQQGRPLVCVPNGVVVRIASSRPGAADAVTR